MSVLIIIDLLHFQETHCHCFNLAISRSQFEIGFLLNEELKSIDEWASFLKPQESLVVKLCDQIKKGAALHSESLISFQWKDILKLRDKLRGMDMKQVESSLMKSSVLITFPLVILLGSKLARSLDIPNGVSDNSGKTGKPKSKSPTPKHAKKVDKMQNDVRQAPVVSHDSSTQFSQVLDHLYNQLKSEKGQSKALKLLKDLNLLFYALISKDRVIWDAVINFADKLNILNQELSKIYPENHTLLTFLSIERDFNFQPDSDEEKLFALQELLSKNLPDEVLLHEFEGKNFFQWYLTYSSVAACRFILEDSHRRQLFITSLGYSDQMDEIELTEIYTKNIVKCGRGILYAAACSGEFETLNWAINMLKEFNYLLKIEMERVYSERFGHTILIVFCRTKNATAEGVKLILENGFPNELLTHESQLYEHYCNALDRAIRAKNYEVVRFLLSDEKRKEMFLSTNKREEYLPWIS
ncbi:uncharacterized protein LOC142348279 [Convolutriloba macropyga]|uniref:uncharacterized protein LOC142348279 n=1 Tax=Convolutriloba macropyga TaxID=536237 RepID=UPI003F5227E4